MFRIGLFMVVIGCRRILERLQIFEALNVLAPGIVHEMGPRGPRRFF